MGLGNLLLSRVHSKGFCAFCKAERKYVVKKHLHFFDVLCLVVLSGVTSSALWAPFDPRSMVLLALFIGAGETFMYMRWRFGVVCKYCGFDPVLYNVAPDRARERVRAFYESKTKSSGFLLSKSPLLELHRERLAQERLKLKLQRVKSEDKALPPPSF